MTLPETGELFTALGERRLTTSDVERLWRRTEGWVAGLRLAAAGFKDCADGSAAVAEFSGRIPVVADLLASHVCAAAGPPIQQTNCHPFRFENWLFTHNGALAGFGSVKRDLTFAVDPSLYPYIQGTTGATHSSFFTRCGRSAERTILTTTDAAASW